jgi:hypothetical protein
MDMKYGRHKLNGGIPVVLNAKRFIEAQLKSRNGNAGLSGLSPYYQIYKNLLKNNLTRKTKQKCFIDCISGWENANLVYLAIKKKAHRGVDHDQVPLHN